MPFSLPFRKLGWVGIVLLAALLACQQSAVSSPPLMPPTAVIPTATAFSLRPTASPTRPPTILVPSPTSRPLPTATPTPAPTRVRTFTPFPTLPPLLTVPPGRPFLLGTPLPAVQGKLSAENIRNLELLGLWGEGQARVLAWSPDGRLLVVARSNGFGLYDGSTLAKLRFQPVPEGVSTLAFSLQGERLALGLADGGIELWQVVTGVREAHLESGFGAAPPLAFSPDGGTLAAAGGNTLQLWAVASGEQRMTLGVEDGARLGAVAYSPDGRWLAAGGQDGRVTLWHAASGEPAGTFDELSSAVTRLAFSPQGTWLAAGSGDGRLAVWHTDSTGRYSLETAAGQIKALAFSPDGARLLCACSGGVTAWQAADGAFLSTALIGAGDFLGAAFSPDGQVLAVHAEPSTLALWPVAGGAPLQTNLASTLGSGPQLLRALTPNGRWLVDSRGGAVHLWRVKDGVLFSAWQTPSELVQLQASLDSNRLVGLGEDGAVYLWHVADGALMGRLPIADNVEGTSLGPVKDIALSADRKLLAALSDSHLLVLNTASGSLRYALTPFPDRSPHFEAVAFSPSGYWLAASGQDGAVYLWKVSTGQLQQTLQLDSPVPVHDLAFSPDSRLLVAGGEAIRLWQVSSGEQVTSLPTRERAGLYGFCFSPDSRLVAGIESVAEGIQVVHLWRSDTAEEVHSLALSGVERAFFSADGNLFFVQSGDGVIYVWGVPQP